MNASSKILKNPPLTEKVKMILFTPKLAKLQFLGCVNMPILNLCYIQPDKCGWSQYSAYFKKSLFFSLIKKQFFETINKCVPM